MGYSDELYEDGVLDDMFEAYQTLLADLLDCPMTWEKSSASAASQETERIARKVKS